MNCEQWQEDLIDLLAGELEVTETVRLEQHLDECPLCRAEERPLSRVFRAASEAGPAGESGHATAAGAPSRLLLDRVLAQVRQANTSRGPGRLWTGRVFPLRVLGRRIPACAAALLIAAAGLGGLWIGRRPISSAEERLPVRSETRSRPAPLDVPSAPIAFATTSADAALAGPVVGDSL